MLRTPVKEIDAAGNLVNVPNQIYADTSAINFVGSLRIQDVSGYNFVLTAAQLKKITTL
jgi:hypothetical protein